METTPGGVPAKRIAFFAVQAGPRIDEEIPISSPHVRIGSGRQNEVVIEDDSISSRHAELSYEDGAWRIIDLESTNGTFMEGVRLAPNVPTPLPYGSTLRFGGLRLHFRPELDADPEAARASYTAPAAETPLAERNTGFRLPLWALVAIILLVIVLAVGIFSWMEPGGQDAPQQQNTEQVDPAPAPADPAP